MRNLACNDHGSSQVPSNPLPHGAVCQMSKHDQTHVCFCPFLTCFWSQNGVFSRHLGTLEGPKWLKMGSFHLIVHPKWSALTFGNTFCTCL